MENRLIVLSAENQSEVQEQGTLKGVRPSQEGKARERVPKLSIRRHTHTDPGTPDDDQGAELSLELQPWAKLAGPAPRGRHPPRQRTPSSEKTETEAPPPDSHRVQSKMTQSQETEHILKRK